MPKVGDVMAASVRAERARRRWTQAELAERLGWSVATVADLETGRRRVVLDDAPRICAAFDMTLAKLLSGANPDDLTALGL